MSINQVYCKNCKRTYNVRLSDIKLMKEHYLDFDGKTYTYGCFFKDLTKIKKVQKS